MPRDKMRSNLVTTLIVLLMLFGLVQTPGATNGRSATHLLRVSSEEIEETSQITPHVPIAIDGDFDFTATVQSEGWSGNGTKSNPYLIKNLLIDLGGSSGDCISIGNTRAYFIIQDCSLTGASVNLYSGIYLDNVTNGLLVDNSCWSNNYGIKIEDSNNNTLNNNTCYNNNWYGIWLLRSGYNGVFDNICNESVYGSGIVVELSDLGNEIFGNTCNGNDLGGIQISSANSNKVISNICIGNQYSGIVIQVSDSNSIYNNTISNNYFAGISCLVGSSNTIINNTCFNDGNGVYIESSSDNTIIGNTLLSHSTGVWLTMVATSNTVSNNSCSGSSISIELDSNADSNDILWNIFEAIYDNAFDDGTGNVFDYNYWSDYTGPDVNRNRIGDVPRFINGTIGTITNEDPHPLIFPWGRPPMVWIEHPSDRVVIWNESFSYDLNVTAYGGVDHWWLNDTVNFDVNQAGIIVNETSLEPMIYGLRVSVNDTYGNLLSTDFSISVVDTTPPEWSEEPLNQVLECGNTFTLVLNATDVLLDSWWLNDTIHFAIDNKGILTSIGILPVGVYGLQVWVNDTTGNLADTSFTVTVIDTKPPVWVQTPENQTIVSGASFVCNLNATDPSGIAEWWVDDTVYFTIDWMGIIRTTGTLEPGFYGLRVYVSDIYGHTLTASIVVEVKEAIISTTVTTPTTTTATVSSFPAVTFIVGIGVGGGIVILLAWALNKKRVKH